MALFDLLQVRPLKSQETRGASEEFVCFGIGVYCYYFPYFDPVYNVIKHLPDTQSLNSTLLLPILNRNKVSNKVLSLKDSYQPVVLSLHIVIKLPMDLRWCRLMIS